MKPEQESKPVIDKTEAEVEEEMAVRPAIKLTRQQIYDEVWRALRHGTEVQYSVFFFAEANKRCKRSDSAFWLLD